MNRNSIIKFAMTLLLLVGVCLPNGNPLHAQTIIDDLQSQIHPSDGVIRIESDPAITALIGKPGVRPDANGDSDFTERSGYRIQVFMRNGNDPSVRPEATARQASIRSAFPELPAYLLYEAPNWRLIVGDFITREEANMIKQRLQREFPQFGKEMYIISDVIRFPVER
ncbi:MAG: SPOR domain-containing protein [Dysgonamonadaceae bacterium]|jgi:hypothetical protein|nr:SPOR domain-containing protein [Dysgonamonadaceae bacterium]